MAAFNFPNSPSTNDLHTENGVTYKWNGTVWKRQNASYTDATNLNVTGIATFANNVSIGGVLTYEDVKNVDSVGIITARSGIKVTGGTLNVINSENTLGILSSTDDGANLDLFDNDTQSRIRTVDGELQLRADVGNAVADSSIRFFVDSANEKVRIDSSGNVGIGSDAPEYALVVQGGASNTPILARSTDTRSQIAFMDNATSGAGHVAVGCEGSSLFIRTGTGAKALTIDTAGRVLIGHTSARIATSTVNPFFQLEGEDYHASLSVIRNSANAPGPYFVLGKSRSGAVGGTTIVQDNDTLGSIRFAGADGVDMVQYGGAISVIVDGTPGADSMPAEMIFQTNTGSGNPTEKLRITKQGRVSINDSTPESFATLQIKNHTTHGASQILLHGDDMAQIIMRDDTGGTNTKCTTIRNDEGDLIFGTHNDAYSGFSGKLRIASDGKVGISEASPQALLHLNDGANSAIMFGNTTNGYKIRANVTGSNDYGLLIEDEDGVDLYRATSSTGTTNADTHTFFTAGSEKLRIDSSGRVIIGGTSSLTQYGSQSHLQVAGTGYDGSTIALRRDQNNANPPGIVFAKSRAGSLGGNTIVQDDDQVGSLVFAAADGTDLTSVAAEIKVQIDGTPGSNDVPGRIVFATTADGASSATERLRITSAGNVGIGITNPNSTLHLATDASPAQGTDFATLSMGSPTQPLRKVEMGARRSTRGGDWDNVGIGFKVHPSNNHLDAPETKMVLDYDGKVGINETSPLAYLHVKEGDSGVTNPDNSQDTVFIENSANAGITIATPNANTGYLTFADPQDSNVGQIIYRHSDNSMAFFVNAAERVSISSGGTFAIAGGANDTANIQLQDNNIGGVRVEVADESISSAIYLPRDGAMVLITTFSNPDVNGTNYPQANLSGLVYVDCGPSRNIRVADIGTHVGGDIVAKNAYTGTVGDCDNNKLTVMSGNTEGTFRLVNRIATQKYLFCITML